MKVLIYGHTGWIGNMFINILQDNNIHYIKAGSRADNMNDVIDELNNVKPTHVISFIGRTHGEGISTIDYLEQDGKIVENIKDNLYAPLLLALQCSKMNIHFTYLGTGCIFNEVESTSRLYNETELPNFFGSSYSIVKGFTDRLMRLNTNTLNLRIRMPINDEIHNRNFITKIVNYEKICSIPNSMSVLPTIYPIIYDMMKKNIKGTFNMTNPEYITHNEILEMYKEIIDNDYKWENFDIEEQNKILKSKRSNNYLDTTKIENLYPNFPKIKEAVRECLIKMKENK